MSGLAIGTTELAQPLNELLGPALEQEAISNYVLRYGDGLVPRFCQGIFDDHGFDRLPILADALEEAGYKNYRVMSYLRGAAAEKHLISQIVLEVVELFRSLGGLDEQCRIACLEHLQPRTRIPAAQLRAQMDFMEKYDVMILGESKIELTLQKGMTRLQLVEDVIELTTDFPAILTDRVSRNSAVGEPRLNRWRNEAAFTTPNHQDLTIAVDMFVVDSTDMTRDQQEARGWNDVDIEDLAVAAVGFLAATGMNPFKDIDGANNGHLVRARGGSCRFLSHGLAVLELPIDIRARSIAASAALPPRN